MSRYTDPILKDHLAKHNNFDRKLVTLQFREKYPNKIPVVITKAIPSAPILKRNNFLSPNDITFGKFISEVRKHFHNLNETSALFFFINGTIAVPLSLMMNTIYHKYKDEDGFLYITYTHENTFG
jgi:GABA(A) receptor-associated protein